MGKAADPGKRLVRFMAKDAVFTHPVGGPLMRGMHHIPVDRTAGAEAYRQALDATRSGEVVGVFPEATISRSFEIKSFKSGAARLAAEGGVPLIPMITFGGQRLWTKGHKAKARYRTCIALTVGEPLHPTPDDDPDEVTAQLHARMAVLLERRWPATPTGPPRRLVVAGGSAARALAGRGQGPPTLAEARPSTTRRPGPGPPAAPAAEPRRLRHQWATVGGRRRRRSCPARRYHVTSAMMPMTICGTKDAARHTRSAAVATPVGTPKATISPIMAASTVPRPPGVMGIIRPSWLIANAAKTTSHDVPAFSHPSMPRRAT